MEYIEEQLIFYYGFRKKKPRQHYDLRDVQPQSG